MVERNLVRDTRSSFESLSSFGVLMQKLPGADFEEAKRTTESKVMDYVECIKPKDVPKNVLRLIS